MSYIVGVHETLKVFTTVRFDEVSHRVALRLKRYHGFGQGCGFWPQFNGRWR